MRGRRNAPRALFHFSFKLRDVYPGGRFSSLLEELRGRYTLSDLRWLADEDTLDHRTKEVV